MSSERGVALVVALMAMTMMMALGTALVLTTATDSKIARNFRTTPGSGCADERERSNL